MNLLLKYSVLNKCAQLEEKEVAIRSRKALQVELRLSESELLDTVTLLKKTQHGNDNLWPFIKATKDYFYQNLI